MRVLLTGAAATSALSLVPCSSRGTRWSVSTRLVRGLRSRRPAAAARAPARRSRRPGEAPRGLRCSRSPRRSVERPDRRSRRGADVRRSTTRRRCGSRSSHALAASSASSSPRSCSMYGASGTALPVDESAPLAPLTAYAESKVRSERSLAALASDDFSPVSLRFATAYGASPRLRLDIVLNNLVGWALTTGAVRLQSDGTAWRPLIHVEDMARRDRRSLAAPRDRDPRSGLQRRRLRRELPRSRSRADGRGGGRRRRGRVRRGSRR